MISEGRPPLCNTSSEAGALESSIQKVRIENESDRKPRPTSDRRPTDLRPTSDRPPTDLRPTSDRPPTGARPALDRRPTGARPAPYRPPTDLQPTSDRLPTNLRPAFTYRRPTSDRPPTDPRPTSLIHSMTTLWGCFTVSVFLRVSQLLSVFSYFIQLTFLAGSAS